MTAKRAWGQIPVHLQSPVANYLLFGLRPGSTLTAFFENDLMNFLNCGNAATLSAAPALCQFTMDHVPRGAYGHVGCVDRWMNLGEPARLAAMRSHAGDAYDLMLDVTGGEAIAVGERVICGEAPHEFHGVVDGFHGKMILVKHDFPCPDIFHDWHPDRVRIDRRTLND